MVHSLDNKIYYNQHQERVWRFNDGSNRLWKQLVRSQMWKEGLLAPCAIQSSSMGGVWSTISNLKGEYSQLVKLIFGNGNNILFWYDVWMGN